MIKLDPDERRVLSFVDRPPLGGLPWTGDGTDDAKTALKLMSKGFLIRSGRSATGTYWAITADGKRAAK